MVKAFEVNVLAGTIVDLATKALTNEDKAAWDRDFPLLVDNLSRLVDPELADDFSREASFYLLACEVAKGYFDKPFGGLIPRSGGYGMKLIMPQDMRSSAATAAMHKWAQTISVGTSESWADILGSSSTPYIGDTTSEARSLIAFHKLISYQPDPQIIGVKLWINEVPYPGFSVEPFLKIAKGANKQFKVIPLPGRVVAHPGGKYAVGACFEKTVAFATAQDVDIEVAPLGICFGEYAYMYPEVE